MKRVRLLILATFALIAFGAVSASMASATEPAILTLEGTVAGITGEALTLTIESVLNTEINKAIPSSHAHCKITGFNLNGVNTGKDANLATASCDFEKMKQGSLACRSETKAGTKDPIETVLIVLDLHVAAGDEGATLVPMIVFTVLGQAGSENLFINCGGTKIEEKGQIGCALTPGLTELKAKELFKLLCKGALGKQENATCLVETATCKALAENPLLATLGGKFEGASVAAHFDVEFNEDVLLDD